MPIRKKTADYLPPSDESDDDLYDEEQEEVYTPAKTRRGWGAAEEVQKKAKTSGSFFMFTETPKLLAFLDGAPIDSYLIHWADTKDGRRPFRCMADEQDCALCDIGDNPTANFAFWIAEFTFNGDNVEYNSRILEARTRVKNTLKEMHEDIRKGGPLDDNFFSTHRTGKNQSTQYHIQRVKDRDLEEDWGLSASDARAALEELKSKGEPKFYIPNKEDVDAAAAYIKRNS